MTAFSFNSFPSLSKRLVLTQSYRADEAACLKTLTAAAEFSAEDLKVIESRAKKLIQAVRKYRVGKGGLDAFLSQYDLSTAEGIALMCLAESMLRVNDTFTLDRLIEDKISSANWGLHRGKSESSFVNAASFGLMLTGKILTLENHQDGYFSKILKRFVKQSSEPVIRKVMAEAMKILGRQFVMGRTITEALTRSKSQEKLGYTFSYDMLGEAARTHKDAERYFKSYQNAITAIAKAAKNKECHKNPGISIKLSALHPRYEFAQQAFAVPVLIDRLRTLALLAKAANIGLTVDAEEADRLDMSLDIIEAIATDPAFDGWDGFGLALQAYQKRAFYVIDWLADLAKKYNRKWMIRLVKGAYWDTEIKDSQVRGLENYPVFTRKASTDVSYLACVKKISNYGTLFYPQFATHNAYSVAAVLSAMGDRRDFEFQCLKGMGRALYDSLVTVDKIPCRIYAPVGVHEDLLPYLVRRLLENGANSSFVNRIADEKTPIKELIADPVEYINNLSHKSHPKIQLPCALYLDRSNSSGLDLSNPIAIQILIHNMNKALKESWIASPTVCISFDASIAKSVLNPTDQTPIGKVVFATKEMAEKTLLQAVNATTSWNATPVEERARCLERLADLIQENHAVLTAMLIKEAGKCMPDSLGEIREAIDFCRYYASQAHNILVPQILTGPTGELNQLEMHGRGVIFCISPWNFPLAIFTGQIVAALVAGNCVIAKPAEQTTLIGAKAVELMHQAGIPKNVVQLLPGKGSVIGPLLTADARVNGVMFTGSTETARSINQTLAQRESAIVPLIAETGGQNALIADATALPEQLVHDVVTSAFNSAGQRCSALRVLFVQSEMADRVIELLKGAMQTLKIGDPSELSTDIGPVIDEAARKTLEAHVGNLNKTAKLVAEVSLPSDIPGGTFFAPRAYEISSIDLLQREVFGPVLHIIRYNSHELDKVINSINNTGYGLTLGIHSRIKTTVDHILSRVKVGNRYVNRNMIGAVVGVQPFGGEGLSGTGPKAGGPHYLMRLCCERSLAENTTASGGNASLMSLEE